MAVKHGDTQLAFALLLRYYGRHGFPRNRGELHPDAAEFMAAASPAHDFPAAESYGQPQSSSL